MEIKEMIAVLQAYEEERWVLFMSGYHGFDFSDTRYRIKPKTTRKEITSNWVKDNNIVVGSKVRVVKTNTDNGLYWGSIMDQAFACIGTVFCIGDEFIGVKDLLGKYSFYYNIESLEPYKEEYIPFGENDFDLFCNRWVMCKKGNSIKYKPIYCDDQLIGFSSFAKTYKECFNDYVFIDGSVFGKLKQ